MSYKIGLLLSLLVGSMLLIAAPFSTAWASELHQDNCEKARNIIFMVPDGLSISNVTAARILKNGPNGDPLTMEDFPEIGYQRTHSADSTVTDSAAAASAWACGQKFKNREISCHSEKLRKCNGKLPETILEIAQKKGKATGLVATSQISHATPAAFAAHCPNRYCGAEIARQYVADTKVDLVLGGGVYKTKQNYNCRQFAASWQGLGAKYHNATCQEKFVDLAQRQGYTVIRDKKGIDHAISGVNNKLVGLFKAYGKGKTPELFRLKQFGMDVPKYPEDEPTLPEMTSAALNVLEKDKNGFFLLVEGSQIDWANHTNDDKDGSVGSNNESALKYQLAETLAFNRAVVKVKDWLSQVDGRRKNTLIVVVSDHDTGGFAINGPSGSLAEKGDVVEGGWTTGGHTAEDSVIWSQGPGSSHLGRPLDNTDLFQVMKKVLN